MTTKQALITLLAFMALIPLLLHAEIKIKDEALTALRAENTKLYADLCEMGDMARERSRKR